MKNYISKSVLIIACAFLTLPVIAQSENPSFSPFSLALNLGRVIQGPGKSANDHMEKTRFNLDDVVIFGNDYPIKTTGALKLELTYTLKPFFGIKGSLFNLNSLVEGKSFFEQWDMKMNLFSPTLLFFVNTRNQLFSFGIGPAFNFISFKSDSYDKNSFQNNYSKMGWVVESGFQYPANSRFFGNLHLRYGNAGKKTEGPFFFQAKDFMVDPNKPESPDRRVAAFEIPYSNLTLNFGGGIRLGKGTPK